MVSAATDHAEPCRVALTQMRPGQTGVVGESTLDADDAAMLRAMGLRPLARVRLCRLGEPCIVHVVGAHGCCCRIGLSRRLAERVTVGLCEA